MHNEQSEFIKLIAKILCQVNIINRNISFDVYTTRLFRVQETQHTFYATDMQCNVCTTYQKLKDSWSICNFIVIRSFIWNWNGSFLQGIL